MKRIVTLLFLFFGMMVVNAQPVLNSSEMLPFGSIMQEKYILNLDIIDTTLQGPNQTWDFTGIQNDLLTPDIFITVTDPLNTPYAASFPTSNYAQIENPGLSYNYFNLTSTKLERIGFYETDLNTYSDAQTEYVFPLSLGTSNLDTWLIDGNLFPGNYNLYCLGSGTLMTPGGVFTDALLVRTDVDVGIYTLTVYYWYSSENGAVLLDYIIGDGVFIDDEAFYLASLTTDVKENEIVSNIKYNNPVIDFLQIAYHAKDNQSLTYTVRNSVGQVFSTGELPSLSNYSEIDFSKFASGIYFINITSEKSKKGYMLKLVKM